MVLSEFTEVEVTLKTNCVQDPHNSSSFRVRGGEAKVEERDSCNLWSKECVYQSYSLSKNPSFRFLDTLLCGRAQQSLFHNTKPPQKSTIFVSFEVCLSLLSFGDGGRVHSGGGDIFQCLAPVAFQESGTLRKC